MKCLRGCVCVNVFVWCVHLFVSACDVNQRSSPWKSAVNTYAAIAYSRVGFVYASVCACAYECMWVFVYVYMWVIFSALKLPRKTGWSHTGPLIMNIVCVSAISFKLYYTGRFSLLSYFRPKRFAALENFFRHQLTSSLRHNRTAGAEHSAADEAPSSRRCANANAHGTRTRTHTHTHTHTLTRRAQLHALALITQAHARAATNPRQYSSHTQRTRTWSPLVDFFH